MMNFVTDNTALDLAKKVFGEEAVVAFCKEHGTDNTKQGTHLMKGENFLKEVMRRGCNSVNFMEWCISTVDVSIPELFDEVGNSFLHIAAVKYLKTKTKLILQKCSRYGGLVNQNLSCSVATEKF